MINVPTTSVMLHFALLAYRYDNNVRSELELFDRDPLKAHKEKTTLSDLLMGGWKTSQPADGDQITPEEAEFEMELRRNRYNLLKEAAGHAKHTQWDVDVFEGFDYCYTMGQGGIENLVVPTHRGISGNRRSKVFLTSFIERKSGLRVYVSKVKDAERSTEDNPVFTYKYEIKALDNGLGYDKCQWAELPWEIPVTVPVKGRYNDDEFLFVQLDENERARSGNRELSIRDRYIQGSRLIDRFSYDQAALRRTLKDTNGVHVWYAFQLAQYDKEKRFNLGLQDRFLAVDTEENVRSGASIPVGKFSYRDLQMFVPRCEPDSGKSEATIKRLKKNNDGKWQQPTKEEVWEFVESQVTGKKSTTKITSKKTIEEWTKGRHSDAVQLIARDMLNVTTHGVELLNRASKIIDPIVHLPKDLIEALDPVGIKLMQALNLNGNIPSDQLPATPVQIVNALVHALDHIPVVSEEEFRPKINFDQQVESDEEDSAIVEEPEVTEKETKATSKSKSKSKAKK